jgi:hypothetical protein
MKKKKKQSKSSRILQKWEKIMYAIIIGFAVVSFWRGVWGLWDVYVFPGSYHLSLWLSTITGLVILIVTHKVIKELM